MSPFQFICADYFGDELPLPLSAVKLMERKKEKKTDFKETTSAKIWNVGESKNNALALTPTFDGLFHFETMEQKKNVHSTDTTAAKTLDFGAATNNAVGESKNSSKNKALAFAPAFDGLYPFEMFVSR